MWEKKTCKADHILANMKYNTSYLCDVIFSWPIIEDVFTKLFDQK